MTTPKAPIQPDVLERRMSDAEKAIWRATYGAAFSTQVARMAEARNTSMGGVLDIDGERYSAAEVARGVADEAVLGLRETEEHHSTELSEEATR